MINIIMTIVTALIPLAVKLINHFVAKKELEVETKKKFLEFVDSLDQDLKVPAKIRKNVKKQRDRLDELLKEMDAAEDKNDN